MEAYINDMLVKLSGRSQHTTYLKDAFDLMRQYPLKLNPTKWDFGVSFRNFLGYFVTKRGIEVYPTQALIVIQLSVLKTTKQIQVLTGKLVALNRFISRSFDRLNHFSWH